MRRILLGLAYCLWATGASAQAVVVTASAHTFGSTSSASQSFTVSGGANRNLSVYVSIDSPSATVSSVVFNGAENATQKCVTGGDEFAGELWNLVNPTAGAHNVVAALSTSTPVTLVIIESSGVNQVTPTGTATCDNYLDSDGTEAHNHATAGYTNGLQLDFFTLTTSGGPIVLDGGQTSQTGPTSNFSRDTVSSTKAGGASVTTGASWTDAFTHWTHAVIGLNPAAAAGGCRLLLLGVGSCS